MPEGNVGGGTGMVCHGSRAARAARRGACLRNGRLDGRRARAGQPRRARACRSNGVPVGRKIGYDTSRGPPGCRRAVGDAGSIIVVLATDAPLLPTQLRRVAQRAGLGLAFLGAYGDHYSGDIFFAFSTADQSIPRQDYGVGGPVRLSAELPTTAAHRPGWRRRLAHRWRHGRACREGSRSGRRS